MMNEKNFSHFASLCQLKLININNKNISYFEIKRIKNNNNNNISTKILNYATKIKTRVFIYIYNNCRALLNLNIHPLSFFFA